MLEGILPEIPVYAKSRYSKVVKRFPIDLGSCSVIEVVL
jgi:hypothetical protein